MMTEIADLKNKNHKRISGPSASVSSSACEVIRRRCSRSSAPLLPSTADQINSDESKETEKTEKQKRKQRTNFQCGHLARFAASLFSWKYHKRSNSSSTCLSKTASNNRPCEYSSRKEATRDESYGKNNLIEHDGNAERGMESDSELFDLPSFKYADAEAKSCTTVVAAAPLSLVSAKRTSKFTKKSDLDEDDSKNGGRSSGSSSDLFDLPAFFLLAQPATHAAFSTACVT